MRRIMNFAMGTLIFLILGASAGFAQSAPSGSYQQTCKDIGVRGDVLTARCQDTSGHWQNAQMRGISYCNGDILNDNGALRCNASASAGGYPGSYNGGYYNQGGIPGGSYSQTCQDVRIRGNDLEARCQTVNGDWRTSRLSGFDRCGGDITNDDGYLRCAGSGYGYGRGRGDDDDYVGGYQGNSSYTQTCRDVRREGDTLEAVCQSRDGDWHRTTLNDYRDCRGQIVNDGGNLRCASNNYDYDNVGGGWQGGYRGGIPGGSYAQSCQNVRVSGDDLVASCQKRNGGWRNTKLDDFQSCRDDITNDNGRLRCGR